MTPTQLIDRQITRLRNDLLNCERNPELKAEHEAELAGWIALKAMVEEHEKLREYAMEATRAITNLTWGGSEFFRGERFGFFLADLPFCVEHIRAQRDSLREQIKSLRRQLSAASAPLSMEKPL